jgi:hypothetical protein
LRFQKSTVAGEIGAEMINCLCANGNKVKITCACWEDVVELCGMLLHPENVSLHVNSVYECQATGDTYVDPMVDYGGLVGKVCTLVMDRCTPSDEGFNSAFYSRAISSIMPYAANLKYLELCLKKHSFDLSLSKAISLLLPAMTNLRCFGMTGSSAQLYVSALALLGSCNALVTVTVAADFDAWEPLSQLHKLQLCFRGKGGVTPPDNGWRATLAVEKLIASWVSIKALAKLLIMSPRLSTLEATNVPELMGASLPELLQHATFLRQLFDGREKLLEVCCRGSCWPHCWTYREHQHCSAYVTLRWREGSMWTRIYVKGEPALCLRNGLPYCMS